MDSIVALLSDPAAWLALVTLTVMEVVLGIDNLLFISVLSNKLPEESRSFARRVGIAGALILRLVFLAAIVWIVKLTTPVFEILGNGFSWRDLILIAGGLFLLWKATSEIHHIVDPEAGPDRLNPSHKRGGGCRTDTCIGYGLLNRQYYYGCGHDAAYSGHGDCGANHCGDHAGRCRPFGKLHSCQPNNRDVGFGFPASDRDRASRRRFWIPCPSRLHLRCDGVFGSC